jgi:hypothetical protein
MASSEGRHRQSYQIVPDELVKEPGGGIHLNSSTEEAEARGSRVPGQPGLHSETPISKAKLNKPKLPRD